MRTMVGWEPTEGGKFYVVEYSGMLKTGPFRTKEGAHAWFRNELDREIQFEEEDEKTEVFYGHCPGCVASEDK